MRADSERRPTGTPTTAAGEVVAEAPGLPKPRVKLGNGAVPMGLTVRDRITVKLVMRPDALEISLEAIKHGTSSLGLINSQPLQLDK